jgi:hypothetical protein
VIAKSRWIIHPAAFLLGERIFWQEPKGGF